MRVEAFLLVVVASAAFPDVDTTVPGEWPSLPEVMARNDSVEELLQDPESGFGEGYWEFTPEDKALIDVRSQAVERWSLEYGQARYEFLSGDFLSFEERLGHLERVSFESDDYGPLPEAILQDRAQSLAEFFAWSIEAGLHPLSDQQYRRIINLLNQYGAVVSPWHSASIAFAEGNTKALVGIAQSASSKFVSAYAKFRLAQLTGDPRDLRKAIDAFERIYEELDKNPVGNQLRGRVALHTSRALLLLSRSQSATDSRELLDSARFYADAAIASLPLLDTPVLWAASQRLSSEVFDAARETLAEPSGDAGAVLAAKARRAYELSLL